MARSRNIKPSFFDNDLLAELDPLARLLFIGMWTIADFQGGFEWREKRVKAKLLPYDNCDIKKLAINLDQSGFIRFYSDGDKTYCKIVNFELHQNPHKNERERGSEIPSYSESMRQAIDLKGLTINRDKNGTNPDQNETNRADSLNLIPDSLNTDALSRFGDFWELYDKKSDKTKCEKKWKRISKSDKNKIFEVLPNYLALSPDKQFRKNPLTWLNGECWNDEDVQKPKGLNGSNVNLFDGQTITQWEDRAHRVGISRYKGKRCETVENYINRVKVAENG